MRYWLLVLLSFAMQSSAWAQYPGNNVPYPPSLGPYSQPYSPSPPLDRAMVDAHNAVRARVGVPSLVWSAPLAALAREWANYLISTGTFAHRPNNAHGENLYMISGATASPWDVVNTWAAEARDYDWRSNSCTSVCGHYTQMVWRTTRAVGCAMAMSPPRQVWVCEYDPPGNYVGERPF